MANGTQCKTTCIDLLKDRGARIATQLACKYGKPFDLMGIAETLPGIDSFPLGNDKTASLRAGGTDNQGLTLEVPRQLNFDFETVRDLEVGKFVRYPARENAINDLTDPDDMTAASWANNLTSVNFDPLTLINTLTWDGIGADNAIISTNVTQVAGQRLYIFAFDAKANNTDSEYQIYHDGSSLGLRTPLKVGLDWKPFLFYLVSENATLELGFQNINVDSTDILEIRYMVFSNSQGLYEIDLAETRLEPFDQCSTYLLQCGAFGNTNEIG